MYDPANEHDACGLGFIAHIKGNPSHAIVTQGLQILKNLGYSPTSKTAIARIDAEQAKDLPGTPATASQSFYLDPDWWAKNGKAVEKRFQEWLLTAK